RPRGSCGSAARFWATCPARPNRPRGYDQGPTGAERAFIRRTSFDDEFDLAEGREQRSAAIDRGRDAMLASGHAPNPRRTLRRMLEAVDDPVHVVIGRSSRDHELERLRIGRNTRIVREAKPVGRLPQP